METDDLIKKHPKLYHMSDVDSWPTIRKFGLLSTSSLLDIFEIPRNERTIVEREYRPQNIELKKTGIGRAIIRDQKPLPEIKLKAVLEDMKTDEYYNLLNGKVFFWVTEERLKSLLKAKAYKKYDHIVLTIDTKKLLKKYSDDIRLTSINSGAAPYMKGKRGSFTFQSIDEFPNENSKSKKVAELAVNKGIPDITKYLDKVQTWSEGSPTEIIFEN